MLKRISKTFEERATVVKDAVITKMPAEAVRVVPGILSKNRVKMATPGLKSISNRALGHLLAEKLHSDDTCVMMTALNELKVIVPVTMIAHTTLLIQ